ncbi:hypothetical protein ACFX1R_047981 [Malus domestica]
MSWKTSRFPKNQESSLRSSFFVHRSFKIKPRRPLKKAPSFIIRSSKIKPQRPLWIDNINKSAHPLFIKPKPRRPLKKAFIVHHCYSRSSPKALEDPFKPKSSRRSVQAQKLSKIRSSLFFEFKPKSPRKSVHHCSSRSSPKALEDPSITILQDQAQKPLKIRSSSFIQDQASTALGSIAHPTNQHLTEIESEDQIRERLNFPCSQIGTPSGTISASHLFLRSRNSSTLPKLMASRKAQTVPATGAKNKSVLVATGVTLGITTRSMARATSAASFTSASTLPREQKHPRHEPLITLASLRAPRGESPRKHSESMLSDADSSDSSAMQVMTIGATSIDEQLAQMNEAIARLTRTVEEKDLQIAALVNRLEAQDGDKPDPEDDPLKGGAGGDEEPPVKKIDGKPEPDQAAALMGSLSIQQLQEMITNTIKAQYEGSSHTSLFYSKPYSKRIDALKMPRGYQPPKFMQFDGKGNPKQHVAHFVETCNNAGTEGDYLAKQFVRSLKGNAFEWYTDLEPESINSWEQLEREFLNRFYSTRRTVSMLELTSTKQWKDEPVIDYINRWRTLSLDCKDRLSETSSIEMCIQGMQWGLQYILQGIKPRTFEELATRAHDMELSIAHHGKKEPIADYKNDKVLGTKVEKAAWKPTKEAMTVNTAPVKISTRGKAIQTEAFRDQEMRRRTLKELEEKIYPFPDSDVVAMLDDLLDKKVISLPECRRPEEMNRTDSPRYCKFHRFISHPTEKCFVLKDLIMKLAQKGIIELDLDDVVKSNYTTFTSGSSDSKFSPQPLGASSKTSKVEGWTQVTPKKLHKKHTSPPQVRQSERGQSSSCQPSKQRERVEDDEISTYRSSIPITMRDFLPEDFFNHSVKAPCYEDCEERLSKIA